MDNQVKTSVVEDHNHIFQDVARFRAILFDSLLKPHDMTLSQGWVLVHLVRENGLRQSELAERMEVATVTTSKLIDRLEERGYVERRTDPTDRRSNRVYATEQAREILKVMARTISEVDQIAHEGVDPADLQAAFKVLVRMRSNLRVALGRR